MKYSNIKEGIFLSRPNRFIAEVEVDGITETVHVKNTGRCKELLQKGNLVYLFKSDNPNRKTKYDLVAVRKQREGKSSLLINMDSQIPNDVAEEWLKKCGMFSENAVIRREVFFNKSRFDLYVEDGERNAFIEVKGVTLENDGVASFPDAPTERGIKHLNELIEAKKSGYEAYILFVIQMKEIHLFKPNRERHPQFADALKKAHGEGVKILVTDCAVTEDSIKADSAINFEL